VKDKIYEGKAKILYKSEGKDQIIQFFKDDATAFNNVKKDSLKGKGILNNFISEHIMLYLAENNIPTHFIRRIDNRNQLVKRLNIFPLEVIIRNIAAGSITKRLNFKENHKFNNPILEFCYKDDALGDPIINEDHVKALDIANSEQIEIIKDLTYKINQLLISLFESINIDLIDFKIEFGFDSKNNILLADEISPDSCRLWDKKTKEKMDKDRFRLDLGSLTKYYSEIADRFKINLPNLND
jgi:phosphoribosylaminoimidazole-succinocarboxamide synthase